LLVEGLPVTQRLQVWSCFAGKSTLKNQPIYLRQPLLNLDGRLSQGFGTDFWRDGVTLESPIGH
jgi:hypothetical protein